MAGYPEAVHCTGRISLPERRERSRFRFPSGQEKPELVGFQAKSNWCGCIEFGFSQWKCRDFFGVAAVKRVAEVSGCTVVMPGEHRQDFSFLTREGFDMESFSLFRQPSGR